MAPVYHPDWQPETLVRAHPQEESQATKMAAVEIMPTTHYYG
jgi:hypothetical protein